MWGIDPRITEQIKRDEESLKAKAESDARAAEIEITKPVAVVEQAATTATDDVEEVSTEIKSWVESLPQKTRNLLAALLGNKQ